MVILIILGVLLSVSLISGFIDKLALDIILELKTWNNPYFGLGISFDRIDIGDDFYEEELRINFLFFNIILVFLKNSA